MAYTYFNRELGLFGTCEKLHFEAAANYEMNIARLEQIKEWMEVELSVPNGLVKGETTTTKEMLTEIELFLEEAKESRDFDCHNYCFARIKFDIVKYGNLYETDPFEQDDEIVHFSYNPTTRQFSASFTHLDKTTVVHCAKDKLLKMTRMDFDRYLETARRDISHECLFEFPR